MSTIQTTSLLATASEHLAKLRRLAARINSIEMHKDDLDDFAKTAFHLFEHVEKDSSLARAVRRASGKLRSDPEMVLCEHLANLGKHGKSKVAAKVSVSMIEVSQGWGRGRFGRGGYGVGEQAIVIKFADGTERNTLELVNSVLAKWEAAFAAT